MQAKPNHDESRGEQKPGEENRKRIRGQPRQDRRKNPDQKRTRKRMAPEKQGSGICDGVVCVRERVWRLEVAFPLLGIFDTFVSSFFTHNRNKTMANGAGPSELDTPVTGQGDQETGEFREMIRGVYFY